MRDLLADLARWQAAGHRVALARVVDVEGSGPREPGAAMAVTATSLVTGSVSGGCVEGAVVSEALSVLASGSPRLVQFGYSDDDALAVGLTCGGTVHLFVEPLDWWEAPTGDVSLTALRTAVEAEVPAVLLTVIDGPGVGAKLLLVEGQAGLGHLGDSDLDRVVRRDAEAALAAGSTTVRRYGPHGEANDPTVTVFFESFARPPRLLVFGAVDFTSALVRVAKVLGYHVTVCDAREVFATAARFPQADEIVVDWPHRLLERVGSTLGARDAVCVLTHDPKFDVPAIVAALRTKVGYVGAMGSRSTTEDRAERLRGEGVDAAAMARLMAPIGLDLGARTPEETAVAICAEMIAQRTGRTAPNLRDGTGPIHPPPVP